MFLFLPYIIITRFRFYSISLEMTTSGIMWTTTTTGSVLVWYLSMFVWKWRRSPHWISHVLSFHRWMETGWWWIFEGDEIDFEIQVFRAWVNSFLCYNQELWLWGGPSLWDGGLVFFSLRGPANWEIMRFKGLASGLCCTRHIRLDTYIPSTWSVSGVVLFILDCTLY